MHSIWFAPEGTQTAATRLLGLVLTEVLELERLVNHFGDRILVRLPACLPGKYSSVQFVIALYT